MQMKNSGRLILTFVAILAVAAFASDEAPEKDQAPKLEIGTKVGQRLPHFRAELQDVSKEKPGKTAFDSHENEQATAFVFMSRTCPYCRMYQDRLAAMSKDFAAKGVRFVMVYPTRATPESQKIAYHKEAGFGAPLINDKDASIAAALKVTKTPEIVLVTKQGEIVFRGGIDDSPQSSEKVAKPFLKNACDDVAAGRKVRVTSAPLYG